MEQQQDVQAINFLYHYACSCSNCTVVKLVVIQKLIHINYIAYILSHADQVIVDIKHLTERKSALNAVVHRIEFFSTEDPLKAIGQVVIKIAHRNVNNTLLSGILDQKFENEMRFYEMFASRFERTYFVECYLLDTARSIFQLPILIMRDLEADGYKQCSTKLCKQTLLRCINVLARFHANGARMMKENADFQPYVTYLESQYYEKLKQLQAIRVFLNNSFIKTLKNELQETIKEKLKKAQEYLIVNRKISFVVHGSLTRSKIFIKRKGGSEAIKFIDFQTVSLGSPAIDLGRILLTNLPNEYDESQLDEFYNCIMNNYMVHFMDEYPLFDNSRNMYNDIANNLLYSYVNLTEEENREIYDHETLLLVLTNLATFDGNNSTTLET